MQLQLRFRALALLLAAACAALLGFGLFLQHAKGIEPCPMCIMQRYGLFAAGLLGLAAGLQGPGPSGRRLYGALLAIASLAGGGVAARQSWIQWYPPAVTECGPDLEFMLGSFPLADALPMIFRGAGDCSQIDWTFLGLSIANWSFLCFAAILALALYFLAGKAR